MAPLRDGTRRGSSMTGNHFIDTLPPAERTLVVERLRPCSLVQHEVLLEQLERVQIVTFPVDCQVENVLLRPDGSAVETAVVGREGISGLLPFIARAPSAWRTTVSVSGSAWQMPSELLTALFETNDIIRAALIRLSYYYQVQATYNAACASAHSVAARVARWILTAVDQSGADQLRVTQEEIANLLAVQRTSVVEAFALLRAAGAITQVRGRLSLTNRSAAEALACSCYGELRAWRSWVVTETAASPSKPPRLQGRG